MTTLSTVACQMRVLVVDDDEAVLRSIARALRSEGHLITSVTSAEEALELTAVAPDSFDVIVSDIMLCGMSGVAFCERLRLARIETPVILISGFPASHLSEIKVTAGTFELLPKPFTPAQLIERVRNSRHT